MSKTLNVGFDYGTSHCSMATVSADMVSADMVSADIVSADKSESIHMIPLAKNRTLEASTLYTLDRNLIYRFIAEGINTPALKKKFMIQYARQLRQAKNIELDFSLTEHERVLFGLEAFEQYKQDPSEGYYIKSPKSFLGCLSLSKAQLEFIEHIVAAMMIQFKTKAEEHCQSTITNTVIGRPIHFHGLGGEDSDRQAITILHNAATTAGFNNIEFLYEPLAAGIDFETTLTQDRIVLVVDIGGGTTDCSIIRMGPSHRNTTNREPDFLAHSGRRIGGNDFDIAMAYASLMPLFGSKSKSKNGKPLPSQAFWNAVEINNMGSQSQFYATECGELLERMRLDSETPELLSRFIHLRDQKLNFQLVATAEQSKIALSEHQQFEIDMNFIESRLKHSVYKHTLPTVFHSHMEKIVKLIDDAIAQAGCRPECLYVTGGMGKSPLLRDAIQQHLGHIEHLNGDYFGSVTAGLAKWANQLFR